MTITRSAVSSFFSSIEDTDVLFGYRPDTPNNLNLKSSISQLREAFVNFSPYQQIEVREGAIDSAGNGTVAAPYGTISYALSQITDNTFSKRYLINAVGNFSDVSFTIRPNISFNFNGGSYNVGSQIFADASWNGVQGIAVISNLYNSVWTGGLYIDFTTLGQEPTSAFFGLQNCNFNTTDLFYIQGHGTNPCSININSMTGGINTPSLQIKDVNGFCANTQVNNFFHQRTSSVTGDSLELINLVPLGTFETQNFATTSSKVVIKGSELNNPNFVAIGAGPQLIYSFGNKFSGAPILNAPIGNPEYQNFQGDILQQVPILVNGAEYNPVSVANSILSNYIPTNSIPTNSSVEGALEGIDAALSTALSSVVELIYVDPINGNDIIGTGSIQKPVQSYSVALSVASSRSPSASNPIGIIPCGICNIIGDMSLIPFVHIIGQGSELSKFVVSGDLILNNYSLGSNPITQINFCSLSIAGTINIQFFNGIGAKLQFNGVDFTGSTSMEFTGSAPLVVITSEIIDFTDCISQTIGFCDLKGENVNINVTNCNFIKDVIFTNSTTGYTSTLKLVNCITPQNIDLITTPGSIGAILTSFSTNITCPLSLDGTPTQWYTDSTSYGIVPTFSNGASIANVFLLASADGVYKGSYTPVNFSPIGSSSYSANSSTALTAGIDDALTHTYQHTKLLTSNVTISQSMVGFCNKSDDLAAYTISIPLSSTISSDAELQVLSGPTYPVTISGALGTVINNSNTIIIPAGGAFQGAGVTLKRVGTNTYLAFYQLNDINYFYVPNQFSEIAGFPDFCRGNLGLPANILTLDQNQDDFLTNPCPQLIIVNKDTAGFSIYLPTIETAGGLLNGNPISLKASSQCQNQSVYDSIGNFILELKANDLWELVPVGYLSSENGWASVKAGGTGAAQDMQETYDAGSTILMNEGQPISISAGAVTPGNGINFVQQFSPAFQPAPPTSWMLGMSFTMNQNGVISALGYCDDSFSSGTRQVGLWLFLTNSTGTLLSSATVAKTDPLDNATGHFRMKAITPISVAAGTRYVIAELNPTTDQYLLYSTFNPSFAVADGQTPVGFASAVLAYPTITNFPFGNAAQKSNATLEFQPTTGYSSSFEINTLTDSAYWLKLDTSYQVSQPFGIGTTAQRDLISTGLLSDGAMWSNTETGAVERWNGNISTWVPVGIGRISVTVTPTTLKCNADHLNFYTGGQLQLSLPSSAPLGSIIEVTGSQGTGWRISPTGSQQIRAGNQATGVGTGYIESATINTCVRLEATVTDTVWTVKSSYGALTVV